MFYYAFLDNPLSAQGHFRAQNDPAFNADWDSDNARNAYDPSAEKMGFMSNKG